MRTVATTILIALLPSAAFPQDTPPPRTTLFAFAAPGGAFEGDSSAALFHFGGGFDSMLRESLSASVEAGLVTGFGADFGSGIGVVSANLLFNTDVPQPRRFVPFVTGGYSLFFSDGAAHAVNIGAGATYWNSPRTGLRFEFRTHTTPAAFFTAHIWGARVGFTWRP